MHARALSYPRRQQLRRLGRALAAGTASAVALLLAAYAALGGDGVLGALLAGAGVVLGLCARRFVGLARRSAVGASSEGEVRRRLAVLEREGWKVRHGLRWGGPGDVDHVAVSPTGVAFAIETKTRRYDAQHLQTVRSQARWLMRRRRRWCRRGAHPVLCITHAHHVHSTEQDVLVVSLDGLVAAHRAQAGAVSKPGLLSPRSSSG